MPTPLQVLGFRPGADYKLADYELLVKYFRALDAASDRVRVVEIGPTAEGRTMIAALITSEANHRRLDRIREISRRLALARGLDEPQARALAAEGRAVVWIDSGLHATEVATAQHAPELAFRVATEESEEMRRIRDEVVLVQVPVMNPDGLDRVVGWYKRNLGTPYEVAPMVELYHRYVGHDNNRDWYMFQMPESRNVARLLYAEWFPQIVYNHHQTAPFPARIFVPPFADPMNPNIPPQVMRGIHTVGDAITHRLEREGKTGRDQPRRRSTPGGTAGCARRPTSTTWSASSPRPRSGATRRRTNTTRPSCPSASATARPPTRPPPSTRAPGRAAGGACATPWTTCSPPRWPRSTWPRGSARTGSSGMYQMGRDAIEAGRRGKPYAYVIAAEQRDPGAAARLVEALLHGRRRGAARAHRVRGGRPALRGRARRWCRWRSRSARTRRTCWRSSAIPSGAGTSSGQPQTPYDITGWTLPAQMGVEGAWLEAPFTASLDPVATAGEVFKGSLSGTGGVLLVDARANGAFLLANRALAAGGEVRRATAAFDAAGRTFEPGTFILRGLDRAAVEAVARERGVRVAAVGEARPWRAWLWPPGRIGLFKPWVANMDEGWTRWLLEQHEFAHRTLSDADVRRGGLRADFDVIVLPDAGCRRSSTATCAAPCRPNTRAASA